MICHESSALSGDVFCAIHEVHGIIEFNEQISDQCHFDRN
jgi:hypothetical protein